MLAARDVTVEYGLLTAVGQVDLEVRAGQIVGLIGPNGAGKSSLLRAIAGLVRPSSGRIQLEGQDVTGLAPHALVARGLVLVPEGRGIFPRMSVYENLLMGAYLARDGDEIARRLELCYQLFPILRQRARQLAGTLSGGQQQMLAIAMGLMARPRLMLLDEPSLGLAPAVVKAIGESLVRLRDGGLTILLSEQNAKLATDVADRIYLMQSGRVIFDGTPEELLNMPDIVERYLGVV